MTVRTFSPKAGDITRRWHVIDASDVVLGRLASQTAILLRGKHKPIFAPHVDTGDFVVIVNAAKVALSGNKLQTKLPKNTLGRQMLRKLKVYAGPEHPHQAQQPVPFEITQVNQHPAAGKAS
jgi:large subunit ribosomal protein L13